MTVFFFSVVYDELVPKYFPDNYISLKAKFDQSPLYLSLRHETNCVFFQQIRFEFRFIRKFGYAPLNKIPKVRETNGENKHIN